MGFLDGILGTKQETAKQQVGSSNPFSIALKFVPMRLSARKNNRIDLMVNVRNNSNEDLMVSVDAQLPRSEILGFDPTCINKHFEKRIGTLKPGERTEVSIPVCANSQTKDGSYPMEVTVFSHYLDYTKVLNYTKKSTTVRIV